MSSVSFFDKTEKRTVSDGTDFVLSLRFFVFLSNIIIYFIMLGTAYGSKYNMRKRKTNERRGNTK